MKRILSLKSLQERKFIVNYTGIQKKVGIACLRNQILHQHQPNFKNGQKSLFGLCYLQW